MKIASTVDHISLTIIIMLLAISLMLYYAAFSLIDLWVKNFLKDALALTSCLFISGDIVFYVKANVGQAEDMGFKFNISKAIIIFCLRHCIF